MTHEELLSHQPFVRDLARRLLADDGAADDVAQDAMVAAIERPPRPGSHVRAWLATVVKNLVRRGARGERRRDARERAAARPEAAPSDHDAIERLSWHRRVVDAVLALEEPYRRTVVLRHYESLPPREVARVMGVPVATVRTRLYRAYALLRARLLPHGEWRAGLFLLLAPGRGAIPGVLVMGTKAKLATVAALALLLVGGLYATRAPSRAAAPRASAETPPVPPSPPETPPAEATAAAIAIDRDRDLHGVVVDGSDRPVADALVETLHEPWQRARLGPIGNADETVAGPATRTAADGTFALRLRPGDSVMLRASAEGFATTRSPARQAGERVKVVLSRGASLSVRVIDAETSSWVEGATVTLQPGYLSKNRDWDLIVERRRGTTDATGGCRFEGLEAPMEARLQIDGADHVWDDRVVSLREGEVTTVDVPLKRGHDLRGVVVDADTKTLIEGAEVDSGLRGRKTACTGRDGRFVLHGVPHGQVGARAEGYALGVVFVASREPLRYRQYGEGEREGEEVEIHLRRGTAATGRVLSTDGTPIGGALVAATGTGGFGVIDPRTTRTGPDGRFTLAALQPLVRPHVFVAMAPGHGRVLFRFDAPGPVDLGDIRLPGARTVTGRVLGPKSEPVPRVRVFLRGCNDDKDRFFAAPPAREFGIWWGNTEFRLTDDLGRFRFPDLAPGTYEVAARPEEGLAVSREVKVEDDTDVELKLEFAHELTVRVTDTQGLAIPKARIHVQYGREHLWKTADDLGVAVVALPAPATRVGFVQGLDWDGFLPSAPVDPGPDAREVTLTVRRAATVAGRVVDKDGAPVAEVAIASDCAGERIALTATAKDGSFLAKAPLGGTVDLIVISDTLAGELRGAAAGSEGLALVVHAR